MTVEAEVAKSVSYQFECKKDALRQTQSGDVKVTFTIHPQDMPGQLYQDAMGQRFVCVLVPLADDDSPKVSAPSGALAESPADVPEQSERQPERRDWGSLPYPTRAAIRCSEDAFQSFLFTEYPVTWVKHLDQCSGELKEAAAAVIREKCGVASRSEIAPGSPAAKMFDKIESQYRLWKRFEENAA